MQQACSSCFFLAESANIITANIFTTILILGAFHNPNLPEWWTVNFIIKTLVLAISFLWIWASQPGLQYNQPISYLLWKKKTCLSLAPVLWICHVSLPIITSAIPSQPSERDLVKELLWENKQAIGFRKVSPGSCHKAYLSKSISTSLNEMTWMQHQDDLTCRL